MGNLVAIVGRPNVGKSTFFNRLIERREAIVDDISGVTRDRIYGHCFWNGKTFSVVDTGGYVDNSKDVFEQEIAKQVIIAIEEADVIVFIVDVEVGISDLDETVANILRRTEKPVFVAVNKVDNNERIKDSYEFYNLGLGEIFCISSMNGSGTGDLLDAVADKLIDKSSAEEESELPKFAIVGRPNVGKSSLTNALVGEDRNIVTDVAGTTRDSINIRFNKFGHDFLLIDTAGLRKKTKVHEDLEFYSVMRAIRAIEHSDVCFIMIDAQTDMESQDVNILMLAKKNKKGVVILVNKWDLIENKESNTVKKLNEQIKHKIAPFDDVPILFISVLNKQRIFDVLNVGMEVYNNLKQRIPTSKLNEYLLEAITNYPPPAVKGKYIKIKYVTQLPTKNPKFVFFANLPQYIKAPYVRYLENKIREKFNFKGVPIDILFRKK
jgi:GTPase